MAKIKKTSSPKKKRKSKPTIIDGHEFGSKSTANFYLELQELKQEGLISQYKVPTKNEQVKNKLGAKKCEIDTVVFDSMMEAKFYIHLLKLKKKGEVIDIALQPKYELQEGFYKFGKKVRAITYKADFLVTTKDKEKHLYDVKGYKTDAFRLKQKLFDNKFRDTKLICITQKKKGWVEV